eukprot:CAMPEP_0194346742 /NCGR_PEP_ID=MMETSP0171-20130528/105596_1 /TAXON_ID=218684 /ORGANISM="Corethron pennatum, Strain L29A3" /LENGTH=513 /DNA_ID=CAMNT_0039113903 /DNA_START=113 /DNA_END=1659 /DNA_ORIENTATION=+
MAESSRLLAGRQSRGYDTGHAALHQPHHTLAGTVDLLGNINGTTSHPADQHSLEEGAKEKLVAATTLEAAEGCAIHHNSGRFRRDDYDAVVRQLMETERTDSILIHVVLTYRDPPRCNGLSHGRLLPSPAVDACSLLLQQRHLIRNAASLTTSAIQYALTVTPPMHGHAAGNAAQPSAPAAAGGFGVHASNETASGIPGAVRAAAATVPDASSTHLASGMNIVVPNAVVLVAGGLATLLLDDFALYLLVQEKEGDRGASSAATDLAPFELGADDKTPVGGERAEGGEDREEQRLRLVRQLENVQVQAPESVRAEGGEDREEQRLRLVRQLENVQVQAPESVVPVPALAERLPAAKTTRADDPLLETDKQPALTSEELERQLENAREKAAEITAVLTNGDDELLALKSKELDGRRAGQRRPGGEVQDRVDRALRDGAGARGPPVPGRRAGQRRPGGEVQDRVDRALRDGAGARGPPVPVRGGGCPLMELETELAATAEAHVALEDRYELEQNVV